MDRLWKLLNSRTVAAYLLLAMLFILAASAFLPSEFTLTEEQWARLQSEMPVLFWLSSNFSTNKAVKNPGFIVLSVFLFLSTLACTVTRVTGWLRTRKPEFEKEKAFLFSVEAESAEPPDALRARVLQGLVQKRWEVSAPDGSAQITAARSGSLGFWGSIAFHAGLILCFMAAPVTALTVFRGLLVVTEGEAVPMSAAFESVEGRPPASLLGAEVAVRGLKGVYYKGVSNVDFSGTLRIRSRGYEEDMTLGVNKPAEFMGHQFTLQEFGYSTRVVVEKSGEGIFDYFLNLRHPESGDYFPLSSEGLTMYAIFFPDFIKEGSKIGSKTKEPNNPVLLIKLLRGGEEAGKGLLRPGEAAEIGGYRVGFEELRNWAGIIVVRESGLYVIILGVVIGLAGLFVRFLSNERRLEFEISGTSSGTAMAIRGYSRYYPAFLEKEVREMSERLIKGGWDGVS